MLTFIITENLKFIVLKIILLIGIFFSHSTNAMENPNQPEDNLKDNMTESYYSKFDDLMISIRDQDEKEVQQLLKDMSNCLQPYGMVLWVNQIDRKTNHLPLTLAVETGNCAIIQLLKDSGAKSALSNGNQVTAIELAEIRKLDNHEEALKILRILIPRGFNNFNSISESEQLQDVYDPLMRAVQSNETDQVKKILQENQSDAYTLVNNYNELNCLPLNLALKNENLSIVKLLIDAQANPVLLGLEYLDELQKTDPKMLSSINKILLGAVQKSLNSVPTMELAITQEEILPNIMEAITDNNPNKLRQVINYAKQMHFDISNIINQIDPLNQHTPLTLATTLNNIECIQILLINGANIFAQTGMRLTALEIAEENSLQHNNANTKQELEQFKEYCNLSPEEKKIELTKLILDLIKHIQFYKVQYLITDHIVPNFNIEEIINCSSEESIHIPLTLAVKKQNFSLVKELINFSANPLLPNKKGKTALDIAIHKKDMLGIANSVTILEIVQQTCSKFFYN